MRYQEVDSIAFTNVNGVSRLIKDKREFPSYNLQRTIKVSALDELDEICTREEMFGDDSEDLNYKLFEANAEKILDANLDFTNIRTLGIPIK